MGTVVTIEVVHANAHSDEAVDRAFGWFHEIEARCTRFRYDSELTRLTAQVGVHVPASPILYEAVQFALMVAEESGGAFDPTVGHRMEAAGFNREHRTGETFRTAIAPDDSATYRDILLDPDQRTILLRRSLTLDLGAVAKGLAIDTAARELEPFRDFAIDAGGDLYMGGSNEHGAAWSVGIRHPHGNHEFIERVSVSNQAVCTSGNYERPGHLLDPRTKMPSDALASATVIAPSAMLADAMATAAFVLGPQEGIRLLSRLGVEGLLVTSDLQRYGTRGLCRAA
jgi:thiamine biosynthesis lipoprotein